MDTGFTEDLVKRDLAAGEATTDDLMEEDLTADHFADVNNLADVQVCRLATGFLGEIREVTGDI